MRMKSKTPVGVLAAVLLAACGLLATVLGLNGQTSAALGAVNKTSYAVGATVTEQSIERTKYAEILKAWGMNTQYWYCDPTEGQISMMQAINETSALLTRLSDAGVLQSVDTEQFSRTDAALQGVLSDDGQTQDPNLCFWTVHLVNDNLSVTANVHAVSGKVCTLVLSPNSTDRRLANDAGILNKALKAYLRYWDLKDGFTVSLRDAGMQATVPNFATVVATADLYAAPTMQMSEFSIGSGLMLCLEPNETK